MHEKVGNFRQDENVNFQIVEIIMKVNDSVSRNRGNDSLTSVCEVRSEIRSQGNGTRCI